MMKDDDTGGLIVREIGLLQQEHYSYAAHTSSLWKVHEKFRAKIFEGKTDLTTSCVGTIVPYRTFR